MLEIITEKNKLVC